MIAATDRRPTRDRSWRDSATRRRVLLRRDAHQHRDPRLPRRSGSHRCSRSSRRTLPQAEAQAEDARSLIGLVDLVPEDLSSTPSAIDDGTGPGGLDVEPATRDRLRRDESRRRTSSAPAGREQVGLVTTTYFASYRYVPRGSGHVVQRVACVAGGTARTGSMTGVLVAVAERARLPTESAWSTVALVTDARERGGRCGVLGPRRLQRHGGARHLEQPRRRAPAVQRVDDDDDRPVADDHDRADDDDHDRADDDDHDRADDDHRRRTTTTTTAGRRRPQRRRRPRDDHDDGPRTTTTTTPAVHGWSDRQHRLRRRPRTASTRTSPSCPRTSSSPSARPGTARRSGSCSIPWYPDGHTSTQLEVVLAARERPRSRSSVAAASTGPTESHTIELLNGAGSTVVLASATLTVT